MSRIRRAATLQRYKAALSRNPDFVRYSAELAPEVALEIEIARLLEQRAITRAEVARRMGTHPPAVTRLFRRKFENVTLGTLKRLARSLDADLRISLVANASPAGRRH